MIALVESVCGFYFNEHPTFASFCCGRNLRSRLHLTASRSWQRRLARIAITYDQQRTPKWHGQSAKRLLFSPRNPIQHLISPSCGYVGRCRFARKQVFHEPHPELDRTSPMVNVSFLPNAETRLMSCFAETGLGIAGEVMV
jgi:hypothetical protein